MILASASRYHSAGIALLFCSPGSRTSLLTALACLCCATALAQQPYPGKRKLGPEINTEQFREFGPIIAADGQTLYFVREDKGEEIAGRINGEANSAIADLEKAAAGMTDPAMKKQMEGMLADLRKTQTASLRTDMGFEHQSTWFSEKQKNGCATGARCPGPVSDKAIDLAPHGLLSLT